MEYHKRNNREISKRKFDIMEMSNLVRLLIFCSYLCQLLYCSLQLCLQQPSFIQSDWRSAIQS